MTFKEFQNTRRYVEDLSTIEGDWEGAGYVYDDICVIEDNGDGQYLLLIANWDKLSYDLEGLEIKLYDWYAGEMGWNAESDNV